MSNQKTEANELFEKWYIDNHHDGDIHPNQQLLEWSDLGGFYYATSVEESWDVWSYQQDKIDKLQMFIDEQIIDLGIVNTKVYDALNSINEVSEYNPFGKLKEVEEILKGEYNEF